MFYSLYLSDQVRSVCNLAKAFYELIFIYEIVRQSSIIQMKIVFRFLISNCCFFVEFLFNVVEEVGVRKNREYRKRERTLFCL